MTPLGIILAIVGIVALLTSSRLLYGLFLFSIPFSGTSILNVGSGGDGATGVQVWMYFGALLLLRDIVGCLLNPNAKVTIPLVKRSLFLATVILVLTVSLVMPVYINGRLQIESPILSDSSSAPLYFGAKNVTAFLYILFGSMLTMSIARRNGKIEEVRFTEKTYLAAGVLTCILGISELLAHLFHFPSPTLLFRNSASPGAEGYKGLLEGGFARVASVAVEPSILAQYLCTVLPLTLPALLGRGKVISKGVDRFALILIILVMLLSTSSVAYLVLLALPLLCLPVISKLGIKTGRAIVYSILVLSAVLSSLAALYIASPLARNILNGALLTKSSSYSALERLKTVTYAWQYFKIYPVLGVGWGSVTSHDVIMMILANSGILGMSAFVCLLIGVGVPLYRKIDDSPHNTTSLSRATWVLSGVLLVFASSISEFPMAFGYLWFVLGMTIAASLPSYRSMVQTRNSVFTMPRTDRA